MKIAILGIHTGIGKTVATAAMAEAMGADYWKPVQAGNEGTDSDFMREILTHGERRVHSEAFLLSQPLSPHAAAAIDGVDVDHTKFEWPPTDKPLLIETAGGVLSPMSASTTMADFVAHYELPAILVVQHYLGSINHSLLSIEVLKSRRIHLLGIVINGPANVSSEKFIIQYANTPIIARIPQFDKLDNEAIKKCAPGIRQTLLNSSNSLFAF